MHKLIIDESINMQQTTSADDIFSCIFFVAGGGINGKSWKETGAITITDENTSLKHKFISEKRKPAIILIEKP